MTTTTRKRTTRTAARKTTTRRPSAKRTLGATTRRAPRVKSMTVAEGKRWKISEYPKFAKPGSVTGMRKKYHAKMALLVRCGDYIYNVTTAPEIYEAAK